MLVEYEVGGHDKQSQVGSYATIDEGIAAGRQLVDSVLLRHHKAQLSGKQLYDRFVKFGPDVYIDAAIGEPVFHGCDYARRRVRQICGTW